MEEGVCYDVLWHGQHVEHPVYVGLKFIQCFTNKNANS